jgi:hypothetical protein
MNIKYSLYLYNILNVYCTNDDVDCLIAEHLVPQAVLEPEPL